MGLVEYSDSECSDDQIRKQVTPIPTVAPKQAGFPKRVNRANPHKIRVDLSQASDAVVTEDALTAQRPAKKPKTSGGGLFSGMNSILPPPKKQGTSVAGEDAIKPGVIRGPGRGMNLKTGAAASFSRVSSSTTSGTDENTTEHQLDLGSSSAASVCIIPQNEPEHVKLIGKATIFKPLSVVRRGQKKKAISTTCGTTKVNTSSPIYRQESTPPEARISLFSVSQHQEATGNIHSIVPHEALDPPADSEQELNTEPQDQFPTHQPPLQAPPTLDSIASSVNLDDAARRQLFGRKGISNAPINLVNFDTDAEYAHNEILRASGETVQHNPVRTVTAGKHSLKQLVNIATSQKDAYEDAWAEGRRNKREAGNKYGW